MAASVAADHPFERREWDPDEGRAFLEAAGQATRSRSSTTCAAQRASGGAPAGGLDLPARSVSSTSAAGPTSSPPASIGPSSCSPSRAPTGAAEEDRPMLQRIYGTVWSTQEELDLYLRARRRASATIGGWASRSTCSASTTSRRARRSGTRRAGRCTGRCAAPCASSRSVAATRRSTRPRWSTGSSGSSQALGALPREHVPLRGRGPDLQPQAHELSRDRRSSTGRACAPTATCRCASPSTACCTATSYQGCSPVSRGCATSSPTMPTSSCGPIRSAPRSRRSWARSRGLLVVRPAAHADVRDATGEGARRPGSLGGDGGPHARRAGTLRR